MTTVYGILYHISFKMASLLCILLFMIFLFLSSIHLYWAFGGKWGKDAAIEKKKFYTFRFLFS